MSALISFAYKILKEDWGDPFTICAIDSFFEYFNEDKIGELEYGLLVASYFLDRRYKMDFVSKRGALHALETIGTIASYCGISSDMINSQLYDELKQFSNQQNQFGQSAREDEMPSIWWKSRIRDGSLLKIVALRLAHLRCSSANIERIFSVIKLMQGLCRTNYNMSALTNIGRVKLSMIDQDWDADIYNLILKRFGAETESESCARIDEERRVRRHKSLPNALQPDVDASRRDPPGQLKAQTKNHLRNFRKLFDFSIVAELRATDSSGGGIKGDRLDLKTLIGQFIADNDISSEETSEDEVL